METLLGLPPMNNNDALAPLMGPMFSGPGDQTAFAADYANRENGLIYTANAKTAVGSRESAKMDFTPCRPGGREQTECNLVAGRDGRCGGAGAVDREAEEGEEG